MNLEDRFSNSMKTVKRFSVVALSDLPSMVEC
jgi:hypothetical protein